MDKKHQPERSWEVSRRQPSLVKSHSWRDCLYKLKQDTRAGTAISYGSLSSSLSAIEANGTDGADLGDPQLSEDFAFLCQRITSAAESNRQGSEPGKGEVSLCRLLTATLAKRSTKFTTAAAATIAATLRHWGEDDVGSTNRQLQLEALTALSAFLSSSSSQVPDTELAALRTLMLGIAERGPVATGAAPGAGSTEQPHQRPTDVQSLAIKCLGFLCGRSGTQPKAEDITAVLNCLIGLLHACCGGSKRLVEDAAHSRFYATLLRSLNQAIIESKKAWAPRAALLVEGLQRFMVYGAPPPSAAVADATSHMSPTSAASSPGGTSSSGGGAGNRYRPPHLRRSANSGSATSDSDASDCEGPIGGDSRDKLKSSHVRVAMLICLQSMAKSDPKALHPFWSSILPVQQPIQPHPLSPHLVTIILYDPVAKVRHMAVATLSALMEGPAQRAFFAVAEAKTALRPSVRGFTTLSTQLGQIALSLHTGLHAAIARETSMPMLAVLFRALCAFLAAAPFERLPPPLLPETLKNVMARWQWAKQSGGKAEEVAAVQAAALACLAEVFNTRTAIPGLRDYLLSSSQGEAQVQGSALVVAELLQAGRDAQVLVRIEALAALKGLAAHYPFALPGAWEAIKQLLAFNIPTIRPTATSSPSPQPPSSPSRPPLRAPSPRSSDAGSASTSPEDKAAQHAVKLLSSFITSTSATDTDTGSSCSTEARTPDNATLSLRTPHPSSTTPVVQPHPLPSASPNDHDPHRPTTVQLWQDTCGLLIPAVTSHTSYMVRSAGYSTFLDLPQPIAAALPSSVLSDILQLLAAAATTDPIPAARSAACKAIGACTVHAIDCLSCTAGDPAAATQRPDSEPTQPLPPHHSLASPTVSCCSAMMAATADTALSVRIAASWALANSCDAFRIQHEHAAAAVTASRQQAEATIGVHSERRDTLDSGGNTGFDCTTTTTIINNSTTTSNASSGARGHTAVDGVRQHSNAQEPCSQHIQGTPIAATELLSCWQQCAGALLLAAVAAVQDVDKVRFSGVRAMGNLLAFLDPSTPLRDSQASPIDLPAWLNTAMQCLQSSLTTGNTKVQWNACYAASLLLRNHKLTQQPTVALRSGPLLLALVLLVRDSGNYKIRTHAAAALCALQTREQYADIFCDALLVTCMSLENLQSGLSASIAGTASMHQSSTHSLPPVNSSTSTSRHESADEDDGKFPNYKYVSGLRSQLKVTTLYLLSKATPADYSRLKELVSRRLELIKAVVSDAATSYVPAAVGMLRDEDCGLPSDPFGSCGAGVLTPDAPLKHTTSIERFKDSSTKLASAEEAGSRASEDGSIGLALAGLELGSFGHLEMVRNAAVALEGLVGTMQASVPGSVQEVQQIAAAMKGLTLSVLV